MGQHVLTVVKDWCEEMKAKKMVIRDIYETSRENNLKEWLRIMTLFFSMRLTKVKEKKEGQLLGYIKKFFEGIEKE